MRKISNSRYNKLLTVHSKLISLRDDFDGKRNLPLSYGNGSIREQLECSLAALDCIFKSYEV